MLQYLIAFALGIFAGTITGLIPGIHINLISIFLISLSTTILTSTNSISLVIFIAALAITHTFIDFIPSVFLGCPDTDTELSVLPGHELLKKGQGYEAVILTTYGSAAAIIITLILAIPLLIFKSQIQSSYYTIKPLIPGLLILASFYLISLEHKKSKAFLSFFLSGLLGLCVLNWEDLSQPLLPLLSGLFGSSMLILSIKNKIQIPKQKITKPKTNIFKPIKGVIFAAPLCSILPGLGSGQAAIIANAISKTSSRNFLVLLGATNTLVMGISFLSIYIINKTRTGAAVAIQEIIQNLNLQIIIIILVTISFSGIIAFFLSQFIAKMISTKIAKLNYTKLSLTTLIFLTIIITTISGFTGLIIFIASTLTGIYCISLKVRRTHMMGCLIVPTIIWYLI